MIDSAPQSDIRTATAPRRRSRARRALQALTAVGVALSFSAVATAVPSQAATTGSYTNAYGATAPSIYTVRFIYDAPVFTAPSAAPTTATITTIRADLAFTQQPTGTNYLAWLCADTANQQCAPVGPTGSWFGQSTWIAETTDFAGWPVTTEFHYVLMIDDGKTGNPYPALNPYRYSLRQNTTVYYTN